MLEYWELGMETVILACYSDYRWLFTAGSERWDGAPSAHFTAPPPISVVYSGDSLAGLHVHLWASHTRRAGRAPDL